MPRKAAPKEPDLLHIEGVPTVAGLAKQGRHLAYKLPDGKWHVTPAGHAVMGAALKAKALAAIERGENEWKRPPSSGQERNH